MALRRMLDMMHRDPHDPHGVRADMRAGRYRVLDARGALIDSISDLAMAIDLARQTGGVEIVDSAAVVDGDAVTVWRAS